MNTIGIFPGSFDPFTKGHEAVVKKAVQLVDKLYIAIGVNSTKQYLFDLDKRKAHITSLFPEIELITYSSLTIDLCKSIGATHIIRGLRDSKDFEYERSIAHMNQALYPVETIFFLTDQHYAAINASIVREIFKNSGTIEPFVTNSHLLV